MLYCQLGSCLKDHTLAFWDAVDNFEFEKSFSIANLTGEYQTNIWYIEFLDQWVTTDKTNKLYAWDISQETVSYSINSEVIRANIIDLIPLEVLKLVAISSKDKQITIWDFTRRRLITSIAFSNPGVHSIAYSSTFQTLISAGYENNISLWNIHPLYFDISKSGRLVGHTSMVTAISVIEKSPMVVSADDVGNIKVWDIRTLNCLQTLEMGERTVITKLIDMYEVSKLCFIGSRVNILSFDEALVTRSKIKTEEAQWPIRVEYNFTMNEFVVCTRKEVRFLDGSTGRLKKVYAGLLNNADNDITCFRMVQQNKKFILGDQSGQLGIYLYATGELLETMHSHTNEVSSVKVDYLNRLIISSGWDYSVLIQQEIKEKYTLKRKVANCHSRKEISILEVSVYHNLFITPASRSNVIYIYDYEYARLIGSIEIEEQAEATAIQFVNGYSIVVISTNAGTVHFFHLTRKDVTNLKIRQVATLDVNSLQTSNTRSEPDDSAGSQGLNFATKLLLDVAYGSGGASKPEDAYLYTALNKGMVTKYHIESIFADQDVVLVPHSNSRTNYNAERITEENFEDAIKNYKITTFIVRNYPKSNYQTPGPSHRSNLPLLQLGVTPSPLHQATSPQNHTGFQESQKPKLEHQKKSTLFVPNSNKEKQNSADDTSLFKIGSEATSGTETFETTVDLSKFIIWSIQAHRDTLTTLTFMVNPDKKLLTSSLDGYVRIWELDGTMPASVNINHPLPIAWKLETNSMKHAKKRVLYGLKVIETIFKRYERKIALTEEKQMNINHFLMKLDASAEPSEPLASTERGKQKLILMSNEYEPRDLQYEKVKGMYQAELQGATLKQMEIAKRLELAHKKWKEPKSTVVKSIDKQKNKEDSDEFTQELLSYLLGDQKAHLNLQTQESTVQTRRLGKKLAHILKKPRMPELVPAFSKSPQVSHTKGGVKKSYDWSSNQIAERLHSEAEPSEIMTPLMPSFRKRNDSIHSPLEEYKIGKHSKRSNSHVDQSLLSPWGKGHELSKRKNLIGMHYMPLKAEKEEEHSGQRSEARSFGQNSGILAKKRSLPALSFYDYANQKNLLSPEAKSVRSQLSTETGSPRGSVSQKERKNEFHQIMHSLGRKLKKSQIIDPGITFQTIVEENKRKETEGNKRKLSEAKLAKITANPSVKSITDTKRKTSLPALDFSQNLESFQKNMDRMINDMWKESMEKVPDKVARLIEEKWRMMVKSDPRLEYDAQTGGGQGNGFVPLGEVFNQIGAVNEVAEVVITKKQNFPASPTKHYNSPSMKKLTLFKRNYGDQGLDDFRSSLRSETFRTERNKATGNDH